MENYRDENMPTAYTGNQNYVFISYSRKDKEIVYSDLREMNKLGVRFWYDDDIGAGENWREIVKEKITSEKCVGIIFYLSKNTIFSEPIETEIKMVFGANRERKNNFAIVIDYDNLNFSLDKIIDNECKKTSDITLLERATLVKNIFVSDNNYLFRTPEIGDFTKHFYKMILRISNFGALPLNILSKLVPDYSDFTFNDYEDGLEIVSYNGKEETLYLPEKICEKKILKLGNECFRDNKFLRKIFISKYIKILGYKTFCKCLNLNLVNFDIENSDLEIIEAGAFYDCVNLKKLVLPKKLKKIEANAFGECEFTYDTIDELYFTSPIPPCFDNECAGGSKLYAPVESQDAYIKASGLKNNVYAILSAPKNLKYVNQQLSWDETYGASSYEVEEDYIPIAITKENLSNYIPKDGLHALTIKALGNFKKHIISSSRSKEIVCGVTPLEELYLNSEGNEVKIYQGVNKTVVLPDIIEKITGSSLIFYNVTALYIPKTVKEISLKTICGIKEVYISNDNPYFYTKNGKIYNKTTNEFLRDEVLGDYYYDEGNKYDTLTHMKIDE